MGQHAIAEYRAGYKSAKEQHAISVDLLALERGIELQERIHTSAWIRGYRAYISKQKKKAR